MRLASRACALLLATTLALGAVAAPAAAHSHTVTNREHVIGGLVHETFQVRLGDGRIARGNVARFNRNDPHLRLRSVLAGNQIAGLETMSAIARREDRSGALVGTNGGFWLNRPSGALNGFGVHDGVMVGGQSQTANGFRRTRGAVGVLPDGAMLFDRLDTGMELRRGDGVTVPVDEANLHPRLSGEHPSPGELIVYDRLFGAPVPAPAGSTVVTVHNLRLPAGGRSSGAVASVETVASPRSVTIPDGGALVLAHGTAVDRLTGVAPGQAISVRIVPRPQATGAADWGTVTSAVPAGPLLLRAGQTTTFEQWRAEAFAESHLNNRHPRTAIGLTAQNEVLLVTVDGRASEHSVGMTVRELMVFMQGLGARDALALDGGGSTTMTVEGAIRNRPSESGRSVANALFVYHSYPFEGTVRMAGDNRYATAAEVATRSNPEGAGHVVLATGESFPDALAGGPYAAADDGPLLLTAHDRLPDPTFVAIDALKPHTVTILGGPAAVSEAVRVELEARGITVQRLAGENRAATAAAIGDAVAGERSELPRVFIAAGAGFADALSAAAPAGMMASPILLADRDGLPAATREFLAGRQIGEAVVVGGTAVLSEQVESELRAALPQATITRLAGDNRFGTARAVNTWAADRVPDHDDTKLVVANGTNFPDALAGGPLAARASSLLMIVPPRDVNADAQTAAYLRSRGEGALSQVTLLGGRAALSLYQQWQLDQIATQ